MEVLYLRRTRNLTARNVSLIIVVLTKMGNK